jgi:nitrosocyanin
VHRAFAAACAAAVAALVLVGCGGSQTVSHSVNATLVNGKPAFSVGTLTVTEGDKVDLRVDNSTDKVHGFSIDAFNVHRVVDPHKPQTVKFTANKTGQFRIYCQLHPAHQPAELVIVG